MTNEDTAGIHDPAGFCTAAGGHSRPVTSSRPPLYQRAFVNGGRRLGRSPLDLVVSAFGSSAYAARGNRIRAHNIADVKIVGVIR